MASAGLREGPCHSLQDLRPHQLHNHIRTFRPLHLHLQLQALLHQPLRGRRSRFQGRAATGAGTGAALRGQADHRPHHGHVRAVQVPHHAQRNERQHATQQEAGVVVQQVHEPQTQQVERKWGWITTVRGWVKRIQKMDSPQSDLEDPGIGSILSWCGLDLAIDSGCSIVEECQQTSRSTPFHFHNGIPNQQNAKLS